MPFSGPAGNLMTPSLCYQLIKQHSPHYNLRRGPHSPVSEGHLAPQVRVTLHLQVSALHCVPRKTKFTTINQKKITNKCPFSGPVGIFLTPPGDLPTRSARDTSISCLCVQDAATPPLESLCQHCTSTPLVQNCTSVPLCTTPPMKSSVSPSSTSPAKSTESK